MVWGSRIPQEPEEAKVLQEAAEEALDEMFEEAFEEGMKEQEASPKKNPIVEARRVLWEAMCKSPGLKLCYVANVAMIIYDELHARGYKPKLRPEDRDAIAEAILERILTG
jgi:hypothetical protein